MNLTPYDHRFLRRLKVTASDLPPDGGDLRYWQTRCAHSEDALDRLMEAMRNHLDVCKPGLERWIRQAQENAAEAKKYKRFSVLLMAALAVATVWWVVRMAG